MAPKRMNPNERKEKTVDENEPADAELRAEVEPIVDWVGDIPVMHGERDVDPGDVDYCYCLCGHPEYLTCPEFLTGGVWTLVIGDPYGGRL